MNQGSRKRDVFGVVTRNYQIANEIFIDFALESHRLLVAIS